jgi:hypothetical protein
MRQDAHFTPLKKPKKKVHRSGRSGKILPLFVRLLEVCYDLVPDYRLGTPVERPHFTGVTRLVASTTSARGPLSRHPQGSRLQMDQALQEEIWSTMDSFRPTEVHFTKHRLRDPAI